MEMSSQPQATAVDAVSVDDLSEAEIQILACLYDAEYDARPTDEASLLQDGERYWIYRADWSSAYASLTARGLIAGDPSCYRLTGTGRPRGQASLRERPDRFWYHYHRFWPAAFESAVHSRLCARVFGADLCQDGMVDMSALEALLDLLDLRSGDRLLDLGCGIGAIAEHIADGTGATVTGLDYAAPAIAMARARTAAKQDRVSFMTGDLNALDLPAHGFDAAISLDSLYWAEDLAETLSRVVRAVRPGGQLGLFMLQGPWDESPSGRPEADETDLALALRHLKLAYEAHDYTAHAAAFWRRNHQAALDLRAAFEAEGNGFIAEGLIKEAEEEFLPAIEAGRLARYLYHVRL